MKPKPRGMKPSWFWIELLVDRLIPYLLILLVGVVIIDLFFSTLYFRYLIEFEIFDGFIIAVFTLDLIFKYYWARGRKGFLREYWLDIIAIIPFFLAFRMIEGIIFATEEIGSRVQRIIHVGAEAEKEIIIVSEAQKAQRLSRVARLERLLRPIARLPRMIKAFAFYEHPSVRHRHAKH